MKKVQFNYGSQRVKYGGFNISNLCSTQYNHVLWVLWKSYTKPDKLHCKTFNIIIWNLTLIEHKGLAINKIHQRKKLDL